MTSAPVGSFRWNLELVATMLAAGAVAVCPVWWAVALWWDWRDS